MSNTAAFDPRAWSTKIIESFEQNVAMSHMATVVITDADRNGHAFTALQHSCRYIPAGEAKKLKAMFSHTVMTHNPDTFSSLFTVVFHTRQGIVEINKIVEDSSDHGQLILACEDMLQPNNMFDVCRRNFSGDTRGKNQRPHQTRPQQVPSVQPHASAERDGVTHTGLRLLLERFVHWYRGKGTG